MMITRRTLNLNWTVICTHVETLVAVIITFLCFYLLQHSIVNINDTVEKHFIGNLVQRCSMEPRSDRLVQSGRKTRSCSQQSSGSGAEVKPCQSAPPPPPPPPPFTRAPLEDRSKYEKLFSLDDSDPEDILHREEEARSHTTHDTANPPQAASKNANQGDQDSIGSATDLKNCSDEDLDDIQQSALRDRMYDSLKYL